MTTLTETYTCRCVKKIELPNYQIGIVVGSLPSIFSTAEVLSSEQVSFASNYITIYSENLGAIMACAEAFVPTHRTYYTRRCEEYLLADRISITLKKEITDVIVDQQSPPIASCILSLRVKELSKY